MYICEYVVNSLQSGKTVREKKKDNGRPIYIFAIIKDLDTIWESTRDWNCGEDV